MQFALPTQGGRMSHKVVLSPGTKRPRDLVLPEAETGPVRMEEELFTPSCSSAAEAAFDVVIGCILEIIMEEDFQLVQRSFLDRHYLEFEESDENKLSYTLIFNEYVELLEKPLEECLMKKIPGFNMASFTQLLMQHKEEVPEEMFDMLLTFIDFMAFKEMFVEYRAAKEGRGLDPSQDLLVTSLNPAGSAGHQ